MAQGKGRTAPGTAWDTATARGGCTNPQAPCRSPDISGPRVLTARATTQWSLPKSAGGHRLYKHTLGIVQEGTWEPATTGRRSCRPLSTSSTPRICEPHSAAPRARDCPANRYCPAGRSRPALRILGHPTNSSPPSACVGIRLVNGEPSAAARSVPSCSANNSPFSHTSRAALTVFSEQRTLQEDALRARHDELL